MCRGGGSRVGGAVGECVCVGVVCAGVVGVGVMCVQVWCLEVCTHRLHIHIYRYYTIRAVEWYDSRRVCSHICMYSSV